MLSISALLNISPAALLCRVWLAVMRYSCDGSCWLKRNRSPVNPFRITSMLRNLGTDTGWHKSGFIPPICFGFIPLDSHDILVCENVCKVMQTSKNTLFSRNFMTDYATLCGVASSPKLFLTTKPLQVHYGQVLSEII